MNELARILCPVDFSEYSRQALSYAVAMGRAFDAHVTALHVLAPLVNYGEGFAAPLVWLTEDRTRVEQDLAALVGQEPDGSAVESIVSEGYPAPEILRQAGLRRSDLVIMATNGRSGFERLVLGSVTERVLHAASCSVMTIPPKMPDAVPLSSTPFARILCATDFSAHATAALAYASALAAHQRGHLMVLHVVEPLPAYVSVAMRSTDPVEYERRVRETADRRLRESVPESVRTQADVREFVRTGSPHATILDTAAEQRADLIVIGVRGRGAADLAFFGSTANQVVRRATCPVITPRA